MFYTCSICSLSIDAEPTERELAVWQRVESVLKYANSILYELHQYKGAANEIREVSVIKIMFFIFHIWLQNYIQGCPQLSE